MSVPKHCSATAHIGIDSVFGTRYLLVRKICFNGQIPIDKAGICTSLPAAENFKGGPHSGRIELPILDK